MVISNGSVDTWICLPIVTSIEPAGKLKKVDPLWFRRQISWSRPERWMLKAYEFGGLVLPNSLQWVFNLLQLYSVRHSIDAAPVDRAESSGFLALSDRTLITHCARSSILDATISIFSLGSEGSDVSTQIPLWKSQWGYCRTGPFAYPLNFRHSWLCLFGVFWVFDNCAKNQRKSHSG